MWLAASERRWTKKLLTRRAPHRYEAIEGLGRDVRHSWPSRLPFSFLLLDGFVDHMLCI